MCDRRPTPEEPLGSLGEGGGLAPGAEELNEQELQELSNAPGPFDNQSPGEELENLFDSGRNAIGVVQATGGGKWRLLSKSPQETSAAIEAILAEGVTGQQ